MSRYPLTAAGLNGIQPRAGKYFAKKSFHEAFEDWLRHRIVNEDSQLQPHTSGSQSPEHSR